AVRREREAVERARADGPAGRGRRAGGRSIARSADVCRHHQEFHLTRLMLTFVTIVLTILLVVDCLLLGLLILIQLPKKEAGVGVAFGGGATDALFGAGSGNALTKLTKYTAGAFFGLVIVLFILQIDQ